MTTYPKKKRGRVVRPNRRGWYPRAFWCELTLHPLGRGRVDCNNSSVGKTWGERLVPLVDHVATWEMGPLVCLRHTWTQVGGGWGRAAASPLPACQLYLLDEQQSYWYRASCRKQKNQPPRWSAANYTFASAFNGVGGQTVALLPVYFSASPRNTFASFFTTSSFP